MTSPTSAHIPANRENADDYLYSKGQARWALFVLSVLLAFDFIDRQIISSLMPAIKAEWSLSDTELGTLVTAVNVAIAVLALPVSLWADRWSRTKSAGIMATLWCMATAACGLATNYVQLLLARFVIGVGEAGYTAPGNSLIAAHYPTSKRAMMIGIFQAAGPVGSILGVVLGGYIGANWGWRYAFGVVAAPGLLFALLMFFVKDYPNASGPAQGGQSGSNWRDSVKALFGRPVLWLVLLGSALQWFAISTVLNWLPSFFNRVYDLPLDKAGARAGLFVLLSTIGLVVGGWLTDRVAKSPDTRLLLPALFAAVTGVLGVAAFSQGPGTLQLVLLYASAFLMIAILTPVITALQDMVPQSLSSASTGAMVMCNNLFGMALGPLVLGMLSDQFGLQQGLLIISFVPFMAMLAFLVARVLLVRQLSGERP